MISPTDGRALLVPPYADRVVGLTWEDVDRHAGWILVVAAGALVAVGLAMFGPPPVALHGPLHYVGIMDPVCGMTRATRLFARGDLVDAWRYNPASFALAVVALAIALRTIVGKATSRWAGLTVDPRLLWVAFVVSLILLEVNQQLHMSLLR